MSEKIKLEDYSTVIENHAKRCFKRLKRPTIMTIEDLVNDGVVMFLSALKKYNKDKGEFLPYLIITLKNRFNAVVIHSYRCVDIEYNEEQSHSKSSSQMKIVGIIQNLFKLSTKELEFISFMLAPPEIVIDDIVKYKSQYKKMIRSHLNITIDEERAIKCHIKNAITA